MGSVTPFRIPLALCLTLALSGLSSLARADIVWYWDEEFTPAEQDKLTGWVIETQQALERLVGPFPFDVHVHLRRRDGAAEPVPWANTNRRQYQSLYFYVDPRFERTEFLEDWTAPHEFSHLLIPYLGSSNAWFAEGFASYLQHIVMVELGTLTPAELRRRRDAKMDRAVRKLETSDMPLPKHMPELRSRGAYPTFYWGGAVYFERVDAALRDHELTLIEVLRRYLSCCRLETERGLAGLVAELDRVSGTSVFSLELAMMRRTPGIPERPADFRAP